MATLTLHTGIEIDVTPQDLEQLDAVLEDLAAAETPVEMVEVLEKLAGRPLIVQIAVASLMTRYLARRVDELGLDLERLERNGEDIERIRRSLAGAEQLGVTPSTAGEMLRQLAVA